MNDLGVLTERLRASRASIRELWLLTPDELRERGTPYADALEEYDRLLLEACTRVDITPLRLPGGAMDRTAIEFQLHDAGIEIQ